MFCRRGARCGESSIGQRDEVSGTTPSNTDPGPAPHRPSPNGPGPLQALVGRRVADVRLLLCPSERGREGESDQQSLGAKEPTDYLPPWFPLALDEHSIALEFECRGRGVDVLHVELEPGLRSWNIAGPRGSAKAGVRRLPERPERKGLCAF